MTGIPLSPRDNDPSCLCALYKKYEHFKSALDSVCATSCGESKCSKKLPFVANIFDACDTEKVLSQRGILYHLP